MCRRASTLTWRKSLVRYMVQFPLDDVASTEDSVQRLAEFAQVAESVGFDAIGFTEHPSPPASWLFGDHGHATVDPFAAMGYCAAVTHRIRLMPYLSVLPYRHPLLTAKAAATVDQLSRGRLTVCTGAGYIKEEFDALGVRYSDRGTLMREGLAHLHQMWSSESPPGLQRPRPWQHGGPPVWVGGNSVQARENVARWAQGWSPLLVPDATATKLNTAGLGSLNLFRGGVVDLRRRLADCGRAAAEIDIQVKGPFSRVDITAWDVPQHQDDLGMLADAGATWVVVHPVGSSFEARLDVLHLYGSRIIAA